ncbi:hypothetical protein EMIT0P253_10087 [Pseudomonas sp. IT-P253]
MITQLAAQLMAHPPPQVDVRNGYNVNNGDDEFHKSRHTSEVNKLRSLPAIGPRVFMQRLNTKQRSRKRVVESASTISLRRIDRILAKVCNQ